MTLVLKQQLWVEVTHYGTLIAQCNAEMRRCDCCVSPVKVSVCVSSPRRTAEGREAITSRHLWRWLWRHCWGPAVVSTGVPEAGRAERASPPLPTLPWACRQGCCVAFQQHLLTSHRGGKWSWSPSITICCPASVPRLLAFFFALPVSTVCSGLSDAQKWTLGWTRLEL